VPAGNQLEHALGAAALHGRREVVEFLLSKDPDLSLIDLQLGPDYVGCVGVLSHRTPLARLIEGDELLAAAAVPLRTTTG